MYNMQPCLGLIVKKGAKREQPQPQQRINKLELHTMSVTVMNYTINNAFSFTWFYIKPNGISHGYFISLSKKTNTLQTRNG